MDITKIEQYKIENKIKTVINALIERDIYSRIHLFNIVDTDRRVLNERVYQDIIIQYLKILKINMLKLDIHNVLNSSNIAYVNVDDTLGLHEFSLKDMNTIISQSIDWDSFNTQFEYKTKINNIRNATLPMSDLFIDVSELFPKIKESGVKVYFKQFQHSESEEYIKYIVLEI